jgi:hypothetical protein
MTHTLYAVTDAITKMRELSAKSQDTAWMTSSGERGKILFGRTDSGPLWSPVRLKHAVDRPECKLILVPSLRACFTQMSAKFDTITETFQRTQDDTIVAKLVN